MAHIKPVRFIKSLRGKVRGKSNVSFRVSESGCNHTYTLKKPYKKRRGGSILNRDAFSKAARYKEYLTEQEMENYAVSFHQQTKYRRLCNYIQAMETKKWRAVAEQTDNQN